MPTLPLTQEIARFRGHGVDPGKFRIGFAKAYNIPVDEVDAAIAASAADGVADVSADERAQKNLRDMRQFARRDPAGYRAFNNEEF